MESIIWVIHTIAALGLIGLVLLQHGKGADMGAAFGSGSSGSLFGASGSTNFLSRSTSVLITVFFITSLTLTYISGNRDNRGSVITDMQQTETTEQAPAADSATQVPESPSSRSQDIPQ